MLTETEKELLEDQDGPLGGRPLFDTVWQDKPELGQAFLEFCELHRPARYIDWSRELKDGDLSEFFSECVVRLEISTRDMGNTIAAFLTAISVDSPEIYKDAIDSLKHALGTVDVPIPENEPPVRQKDLLRSVHTEADRLMKAHQSGAPYPKESIEALYLVLRGFAEPPVEPRQFSALLELFEDVQALQNDPAKVYRMAHYIRFNLPYHEPVLREFTRWCEDPNRPQREVVEVGTSDWIPRLKSLELVDRKHAARTMREVITSPKLREHLKMFVQALQID